MKKSGWTLVVGASAVLLSGCVHKPSAETHAQGESEQPQVWEANGCRYVKIDANLTRAIAIDGGVCELFQGLGTGQGIAPR